MKKSHHQPPSRERYNAKHPTVSIRVNEVVYYQLKKLREKSGKTLGDILREALKEQAPSVKDAYQNGFMAARILCEVKYKCSRCGGTLVVNSDEEKRAIAGYMKEHHWGHSSCPNKSK